VKPCLRCGRPVRGWRVGFNGGLKYFDDGGKGYVSNTRRVELKTIWLPHVCGPKLPVDPIARAAQSAREPDVRAAFEALARRSEGQS
jgi:hypothetical protein